MHTAYTHVHTLIQHTHTHTHIHTYIHTYNTHTHTLSLSLSLSLLHTHTHSLSHTHTHAHTLSLTHTHTHSHIRSLFALLCDGKERSLNAKALKALFAELKSMLKISEQNPLSEFFSLLLRVNVMVRHPQHTLQVAFHFGYEPSKAVCMYVCVCVCVVCVL